MSVRQSNQERNERSVETSEKGVDPIVTPLRVFAFKEAFPTRLRRERWFAASFFILLMILTLGAVATLGGLRTHYSVSQFMPPDHPLLRTDLENRRKFFIEESQPALLTLRLEKGDWLSQARLKRLEKATAALREKEGVAAAFSLATIPVANQSKEELAVGTLLEVTTEKARRARVKKDRFITPLLVSGDGKGTLLVLSLKDDLPSIAMGQVMESARETLAREFPEAKVSVGGVPAIQAQLTSLVKTELVRFMGLALVASLLTLALVFVKGWAILVPVVAIVVTNVFVLAFMALTGFSLTVLAATIPILVSVNVLSICAHTLIRIDEESRRMQTSDVLFGFSLKASVIARTLRSLFMPNLLTSATTSFGFATLIATQVPVIREFGIAVSCAMMLSWLSTSMVLLPLLILLPLPRTRAWVSKEATWAGKVFWWRQAIVPAVLILAVTFGLIGRKLEWSARLFDDLPQGREARVVTEEIDRKLGGMIPFELIIEREKVRDPWNDPLAVARLDQFLSETRKRAEVGSVVGLPDLLRQAMGNPRAKIPKERATIAENWFLISMADPNPLKNYLTSDGAATRLALRFHDVPSARLDDAMTGIVREARKAFPDARVSTGGMATTVHKLNNSLSLSLMKGFWEALAIIGVLIFLVFRSWRWTLMAIVPNLLPGAVLLGVLALAKTPIKPGVALVFAIALGIAFDNTIYLLMRLRALCQESGQSPGVEIKRALRLEGNACLVSSLCLLSGFAIFLMSEFSINQTFGIYMLVSLAFGLIGDLVFLPALIRMFPSFLASKAAPGAGILMNLGFAKESDSEFMREREMRSKEKTKSILPKAAAGLVGALLVFGATKTFAASERKPANAPSDAVAIMKSVHSRLNTKDESAVVKMKVIEANGQSKDREMEIKRKAGSVLIRLRAPADLSGIAVLSIFKGGTENQWLYMPSQKKARRMVSGSKTQKILDTEFSAEDFTTDTYSHLDNKILREEKGASGAPIAVIESTPKKGETLGATYSKIQTWVDTSNYQVQKAEYFDLQGKPLKTIVFRDYKQFGKSWRAQTVEVRNTQSKRATLLKLASLKVNSGLSDSEFTQSALEEED